MLSLQPGHVLFHVPRRPSTGARCDGVRTEMSGVSSDRRPPDGGRDRRSDANRLYRLTHAQPEIQGDPDQCADETIRPVFTEPCDRDLPGGCGGGAAKKRPETEPIGPSRSTSGGGPGPDDDHAAAELVPRKSPGVSDEPR